MMFFKLSKESGPKRILVVSMTNIGDVVLTCPVIDILRGDFPLVKMDVVVGPKAVSLFEGNPNFRVKMFDKQAPLRKKFAWFSDLYKEHYDCVVDLRRTMLPILLMPRYATPAIELSLRALFFRAWQSFKRLLRRSAPRNDRILENAPRNDRILENAPRNDTGGHKKDGHLNRLRQVYDFDASARKQYAVVTTKEDEQFFEREVAPALQGSRFAVIAPGAAHSAKRWHSKGFAAVADYLSAGIKIVFVGDAKDVKIIEDIQARMKTSSLSLGGKINLRQLAFVLKKCSWAMTHDSGVMHLASYLNVPLMALWGPTDINRYSPWGKKSVVVRRNEKCIRCLDPKSNAAHNCMSFIEVEDVIHAIKDLS